MKTAMQELREDLQLTIETAKDALLEIENGDTRIACQEVVRLTLKNIIKRIDDELLEMEKQQIIDAVEVSIYEMNFYESYRTLQNGEQYYNETFNK
jgi:SpoVK/Ycf46/Vps4 family AAA+-type ATPase